MNDRKSLKRLLTPEQLEQIREQWDKVKHRMSQESFGKKYGVSGTTINALIHKKKTYKIKH